MPRGSYAACYTVGVYRHCVSNLALPHFLHNTLHIVTIRQHHSTWQTETKQMIMIQRPMQHPVAERHIRPAGVHL